MLGECRPIRTEPGGRSEVSNTVVFGWHDHPVTDWPTLHETLDLDGGDDDRFIGHSPPEKRARVFGGQVVAQALVAATRTAPNEQHVHSLHAYFLRGGDVDEPIEFEVRRLRDGRSFSSRQVTASQGDRAILVLSASFHTGGPGGDYEPPGPAGVPGPEHLPATRFARPGVLETADVSYDQPGGTRRRLWFRAGCDLPDDLHAAAVAYATDHGPFGAARRLVDTARPGWFNTLFRASLDHSIWFHRPPRVDEWLLYDVEAVAHRDDRILIAGKIHDRAGRCVATVTQEILARERA